MKKLYKSSIIIPILSVYLMMLSRLNISIPEIGLYIPYYTVTRVYIIFSIVWLCCSPFRKSCSGKWIEIIFNLVPVEILLFFIFAQWHFWIAVILSVFLIGVEVINGGLMLYDEWFWEFTKKERQKNRRMFQRFTLLVMSFIYAFPCYIAAIVYDFQSPFYGADPKIKEALNLEKKEELQEEEENAYQMNADFWQYFTETAWNNYTIQEKITLLQELVDFESESLGIPSVPITTQKLGAWTLGAYSSETNEMWIDIQHLAESTTEKCVKTICHETYHAYQFYLVTQIDWASAMVQMPYFDEVREWKENQENYKASILEYEEYYQQPIEATAREYADKEWMNIKTFIP